MTRFRYAASAAALSLLAPLGAATHAAAAEPAPHLVSISYLGAPYARQAWTQHPIAEVTLSAPVSADTTVSVVSCDPMVAQVISGGVTVPAGTSSAPVAITTMQQGSATLTATLGADTLALTPALQVGSVVQVPNLSTLTIDHPAVQPDGTATGTVVLDFLGAVGGTTVSLTSSSPGVTVPATVTVPEDSDRATFPITATGTAASEITATLGTVSKSANFVAADTIAPQTTITRLAISKRTATATFTATEPGSTFRCRIDGGKARACTSPQTYRRLAPGRHQVSVQAVDGAGNVDTTPAARSFRIKR